MSKRAVALISLLFVGCLTEAPLAEQEHISGIWQELREGNIEGGLNADVIRGAVTYTLRIAEQDGFVHGTWTITGDSDLPSDPWEAVVVGDYANGRLLTEYFDPRGGRCQLKGPIQSGLTEYVAEQRCAPTWAVADTFRLLRSSDTPTTPTPTDTTTTDTTTVDTTTVVTSPPTPTTRFCPEGSPTWNRLPVCVEVAREGYDRSAFGTRYSSLEDDIIRTLPKNTAADSVYTPYSCTLYEIRTNGTAATDIEHIVALSEAYDSGLEENRFRTFAGDIDNLTISVPSVNRYQKSDKDAAEWQPARNQGWFASKVLAVKQKYGLSVNPAERDSLIALMAADTSRTVVCTAP